MHLPKALVDKVNKAELIAATYNNNQSVRLKLTCPKDILPTEGMTGKSENDWVFIRPEPVLKYTVPPFYKPTTGHQKTVHAGAHLFLRDTWQRYKRVDNYLKDIFFFEDNKPKPKVKNDPKTSKSHQRK